MFSQNVLSGLSTHRTSRNTSVSLAMNSCAVPFSSPISGTGLKYAFKCWDVVKMIDIHCPHCFRVNPPMTRQQSVRMLREKRWSGFPAHGLT